MTKIINETHLKQYNSDGYFTVSNFLNKIEIDYLLEKLTNKKVEKTGFYTSTCIEDNDYRNFCNNTIKDIVTENKINQYLEGYRVFYTNYINKTPNSNSEVVLHTDWSIMDEKLYNPFKIWIPLIDVNINNGTFSLVKGSHKFTNKHRGFGANEYYTAYSKELIENNLNYLEYNAGQALFYHPGTLHYSPPNKSKYNRPAILISLYPNNVDAILFYKNWYNFFNTMSVYKFEPDFMNIWDKKSKPTQLDYLYYVKENNKSIAKHEFLKLTSLNKV